MKVKFLIIRFSSIGDIILTTPVIRGLKQQVENAEVHYVTKEKYAPLLSANPYIDKLHLLQDKTAPLFENLKREKIDFIIDLHHNIRSAQVKRKLRVPAYTFKKLNVQKWLLVNLKINRLDNSHVIDRYLETVTAFGVKNDGMGLDYFIPPGEGFAAERLPEPFAQGFIACVIGGTYATKRLPVHKIVAMCSQIPYPLVLLGGKHEQEAGDEVVAGLQNPVLNLAGKTTISESADLIRMARLVLTNDTGMMHIAAAYQKKILSFWGNTVTQFGMTPYQPHPDSLILQTEGLKCRPCSKLGFDKCPKGHFRCMEEIDTGIAVNWINTRLSPSPTPQMQPSAFQAPH
jgi:ADP-heptose:LPS heptosyltransferase